MPSTLIIIVSNIIIDSVRPDIRLSRPFKLLLLFCFSMESSHFLAVSSPRAHLQNCFLRFLI